MKRSRSYIREVRNKKIARKKRICRNIYGPAILVGENVGSWYKHDGQYSKGKIHCSCKMCTYSKYFGLSSLKDMREKEKYEFEMKEFQEVI